MMRLPLGDDDQEDRPSRATSKQGSFVAVGESCPCLASFGRWAIRNSRLVIGGWLLLAVACVPLACRFTEVLKITLDPPPGSGSEAAQKIFKEYFPANVNTARYVGYLETADGSILDVPGIDDFSRELHKKLNESRPLSQFMSTTTYNDLVAPLADAAPKMPVPLYSKDKTAMLITWATIDDPASKQAMSWAQHSHAIFTELARRRLGDSISFVGTDSYSEVAGESVAVARADLERTDMFCMPFTALILLLVVESPRMLIITGLAMGVSACGSFACTYLLGAIFPVQAVTPSLMMCLIISMSIDYSIFLLTRFREELQTDFTEATDTEGVHSAICTTMATSGATILLSGGVLLFAFVFLAFFPVTIVASMGIGACITMVIMVIVNLTLVPALLAEFPVFFTVFCNNENSKGCLGVWVTLQRWVKDGWRCLAKGTTQCPMNILLLTAVVGFSAALSVPALYINTSIDMRQAIAAGSSLQQVTDKIHEKFGGGLAYPFEVLLVPTDSTVPVLSEAFFEQSSKFIKAVRDDVEKNLPEQRGTAFNFLSYQTGTGAVPFDTLDTMCQIKELGAKPRRMPEANHRILQEVPDFGPLCNLFLDSTTNTDDYRKVAPTAAYGVIVATVEPMGTKGHDLLSELRRASEKHGATYGLKVAISGTPAKALDMVTTLYTALPIAAVATLATAALCLAVAFRSVLIPIRSLLSTLLTNGVTYGVTVLVYQNGILDWLGKTGVNSQYKSLPWFSPIVAFFIITGIGLDYDIFVLIRVTEFRGKGYDPQRAIQEGLVSTAGIITAAGVVMVCAFTGMLFSSLVQAAMFGFMMIVAVIYDTFIARAIVVPAGMSLLGYWNWWPSELSQHGRTSRALSCECSGSRVSSKEMTGYVEEDDALYSPITEA